MLASYFSPLAPAAALLLGAFVLSVVWPRLPKRWQTGPAAVQFGPPALVGLAGMALLGIRLTYGADPSGAGLELVSGWNFSTAESVAALTMRADELSLAFLLPVLLMLLAVTLAYPAAPAAKTGFGRLAETLVMAAAALLLFVAGNGLSITYAIVIFDIFAAGYWLRRGRPNLGIARVGLGIFTAAGFVLVTVNAPTGFALYSLLLWFRLGLVPLIEICARPDERRFGGLVYLALSLSTGLYLAMRTVTIPWTAAGVWLTAVTMLGSGLWAWLSVKPAPMLSRLVITELLLILLAGPPAKETAAAYGLGLVLSLSALWLTPRLGKPNFSDRAWLWPYLPAMAATATLAGLPLSLGWPARITVYHTLFAGEQFVPAGLALLAEGLALSGLVRYWQMVWSGSRGPARQAAASVVMMVPFLIPGLAPFVLTGLTRLALPAGLPGQPAGVYMAAGAGIILALVLAFFRPSLMSRLPASIGDGVAGLVSRGWVSGWAVLNRGSKLVLRVEVFLQGQHYMGWALLMALVGLLILVLGT